MTSKTIALSGAEIRADYSGGTNAWLRNDGTATVYASTTPGVTAGADGVVSIPAGQAAAIYGACGAVYLLGTGSVQLVGSDYTACPFKTSTSTGGEGGGRNCSRRDRTHEGNADIHISAAEKATWDGKAELSDIPDKLPADGGNAYTLDEKHASDFALAENKFLDDFFSSKSGDIRALVIDLPSGGFGGNTDRLPNITGFPITGDILITWSKSVYSNGFRYGTLQVRSMTQSNLPVYQCSVYNDGVYTDWQKLCDGGEAASVGAYTESAIAALEARIAALEGGNV